MLPSNEEYRQIYGLDEARMAGERATTFVLHPAPINRGVEIDDETADGASSMIFRQVQNGVAVRMAVLTKVLGGRL